MELLTQGMKPPLLFICQLPAGIKKLPACLASNAFSFLLDTPKTSGNIAKPASKHSSGKTDDGDAFPPSHTQPSQKDLPSPSLINEYSRKLLEEEG